MFLNIIIIFIYLESPTKKYNDIFFTVIENTLLLFKWN